MRRGRNICSKLKIQGEASKLTLHVVINPSKCSQLFYDQVSLVGDVSYEMQKVGVLSPISIGRNGDTQLIPLGLDPWDSKFGMGPLNSPLCFESNASLTFTGEDLWQLLSKSEMGFPNCRLLSKYNDFATKSRFLLGDEFTGACSFYLFMPLVGALLLLSAI